ncbi:BON domain-containing protein [Methylotetracoccus oryzae]|uniref:BON domain-containing protein n=1 Tax=Methylotetracoccus oryzae TaxID=1919059 RepID=UPI00111B60F5|nr:BON domain-containing protein [Methylotetracoccus oryzae]
MKSHIKFGYKVLLASMILMANGCVLVNENDGTATDVDDRVVAARIKEAISTEPALRYARINVETSNGIVQLSGFVNSDANIASAVVVARGVDGVRSVKKDMLLK